jgi:hypothetical protein
MLSQPRFDQLCPVPNPGGAVGSHNHRTDRDHDHISQSMKSIDFRTSVRHIAKEPEKVERILITGRQHGESSCAKVRHTKEPLPT